jgi:hypothetical protein
MKMPGSLRERIGRFYQDEGCRKILSARIAKIKKRRAGEGGF